MLIILCNCKSIVFDNCFVFISLLIYLLNCLLLTNANNREESNGGVRNCLAS